MAYKRGLVMGALPFQKPPCPECCNKDTYVELMVPVPRNDDVDEYSWRCGKCGLRYRTTLERRAWMAVQIPFAHEMPACPLGEMSNNLIIRDDASRGSSLAKTPRYSNIAGNAIAAEN